MTFLYFLEEMERKRVLQGVLRRCSLGRKTAILNSKIYLKNPNSADFLQFIFSFFLENGKAESVERSFEIKQFEKNVPFGKYFHPNTAYSCDSLQFPPIRFPALINP
jgi:hypothetical protein